MEKIKIYITNIIFGLISLLVKKDPNIWVFGSWFGRRYSDNSRYLFEYIVSNHPEIKAIWLTDDDYIYFKLKSEGRMVFKKKSLRAYVYCLKASVTIYVQSNYVDCLPYLNNKKVHKVQLWHGIPLKKIGYDNNLLKENNLLKFFKGLIGFPVEKNDLVIACSNEDANNFKTAFNGELVKITGYPRNDCIVNLFENNRCKRNYLNVLYMPTFRNEIGSKIDLLFPYGFKPDELDDDICLKIKMHPVNLPSSDLLEKLKKYKNIVVLGDEDAVEVLKEVDILITDFSSVYFDFLLTERPIIFSPFGFDEYLKKDRELYYDYESITPGPKCKNWDEVFLWVKKFKENKNYFAEERKFMKDRFHYFQDEFSSLRVFKEIKKLQGRNH